VHATAGTALCYLELARLLGRDRPVFGLQARGLGGEGEPCDRIENMARFHVEALRAVQPSGPYLLGGWSLGGVVAYEMARQLQARGEEVQLLALLDATLLETVGEERSLANPADLVLFLNEVTGPRGKSLPLPVDALRGLADDKQLLYYLELAKAAKMLPADVEMYEARVFYQVIRANLRALARYVPGPYDGPVTLFPAAASLPGVAAQARWQELAAGLEVHDVPGDHYTMLEQPHVPVLATRLAACLARATATRGANGPGQ
jgi:thioesterase domain-containing protein